MFTGYSRAVRWANRASPSAPAAAFSTDRPEANSLPPIDSWMMPSAPACANPAMAAFRVVEEVALTAAKAYPPPAAASSMERYFSGAAMGIGGGTPGNHRRPRRRLNSAGWPRIDIIMFSYGRRRRAEVI